MPVGRMVSGVFAVLGALSVAACGGSGTSNSAPTGAGNGQPGDVDAGQTNQQDGGPSGADAGVGIPQGCQGVALAEEGYLTLDVKRVHVQGTLSRQQTQTWNVTGRRLRFVDPQTGATATVPVSTSGAYEAYLSPARYHVELEATASSCMSDGPPCTGSRLAQDVALLADGALDLVVATARVQLIVTFGGLAPADASSSSPLGVLSLVQTTAGGTATMVVDRSHGSATLSVAPGVYRAEFNGADVACGTRSPAPLHVPCGTTVVAEQLNLNAAGAIAVDVPSVHVQGTVTAPGGRGVVGFAGRAGGAATATLSQGAFDTYMAPGVYDVTWTPISSGCTWACNAGTVMTSVSLTADGHLEVPVPSVHVTGTLVRNGAPAPPGHLRLEPVAATHALPVTVAVTATSGAATFEAHVLPGTYRVVLMGNTSCNTTEQPCGSTQLHAGVALTADGALDLQVPLVRLTLTGRVNGVAWPANTTSPSLWLVREEDDTAMRWEGNTQTHAVAPGRYGIRYVGPACPGSAAYPCGSMLVQSGVEVAADGALEVDVVSADVQFGLTLNGTAYPNGGRARLMLRAPSGQSAREASVELNTAQGGMVVARRTWVFQWLPVGDCQSATAAGVPCTPQVLLGCPL